MNLHMAHPDNFNNGSLLSESGNNSAKKRPISRWKAASIHLLISVAIALGAVVLLYFMWYPQPFFEASGGEFLLTLLVAVDVILGPLITLVIFNTKKKSLKFDLAVVALVQLAALSYGMYTMYLARPVFVVYAHSQFKVVTANEIEPEMLKHVTNAEYKSLSFSGPKYVFNVAPESTPDLDAFMYANEGLAPQYYVPFVEKSKESLKDGRPISKLLGLHPDAKSLIDAKLKKSGKTLADLIYFALVAKEKNLTVLADAKTGGIVAVIPVNPF